MPNQKPDQEGEAFRSGSLGAPTAGMEPALVESITQLAASQHGLVSIDQLVALGVSRMRLRTAVAAGWLEPVAPRVYVVAGAPDSLERRQMAGLLCLGPTAALSHETAARLHGFDRCRPGVVEFTMPRCGRGREAPFLVHTSGHLGPVDVVTIAGFRCTSATRTIIDLARARVATVRLEAAIDSAVRSGASSPVVIAARLGSIRGRGRWGAPRIDALLLDAGGHTLLERRFLGLMRSAGLPRPSTQVVHDRGGRTFARVDASSTRSRSSSRCRAGVAMPRTASGPGTPSGATSCKTSAARSTSTRTTTSRSGRPTSSPRCVPGSPAPDGSLEPPWSGFWLDVQPET